VTLPTSAAERRRLQLLIGAQQQTSRTPLLLLIDETDRWTDGHPTVT